MYATDSTTGKLIEHAILPALLQDALAEGNSITLWRMPGSVEKHLLICTEGVIPMDDISLEETKTGFIFAPFSPDGKKMFFRGNLIYTFRDEQLIEGTVPEKIFNKRNITEDEDEIRNWPTLPAAESPAADYQELVKKSVDAIRAGYLEKVVPSRTLDVPLQASFEVLKSFNKLCKAYPDAMVSLVSSEETGTWLGATPELLVSLDENAIFGTVALAGTKRFESNVAPADVAWTEKEIEEQALVGRYIISCFKRIRVREYEESGPRTSVAGNVFHLKTEYKVDTASINFPQLASVMLKLLHPTSAVCGMPLENALTFLKSNEGYDRQYYSGILGPVNFRNESHIYVNLRCLQLLNNKARLYAGAGVTTDSVPEKEWEETSLKFETLLSIIN